MEEQSNEQLTKKEQKQLRRQDMKYILKCCLNPKVLISIGVVIVLIYFFAPQTAAHYWPLLLALVCPISIIVIMMSMEKQHDESKTKLYACPECGMSYAEPEWAKKCSAWCKEHKSCNLEIIKYAVKP